MGQPTSAAGIVRAITSMDASLGYEQSRAGQGSTAIGNGADGSLESGSVAACPSNITDNTVIGQLVLNGDGCNNANNVVLLGPPPP